MKEKKKRGPRLPFGELGGVWSELAQTYRDLKDLREMLRSLKDGPPNKGAIAEVQLAIELSKARCYTLQTMLGVVDRVLQERAIGELQEQVAALKSGPDHARVISTTATMASLPPRSPSA